MPIFKRFGHSYSEIEARKRKLQKSRLSAEIRCRIEEIRSDQAQKLKKCYSSKAMAVSAIYDRPQFLALIWNSLIWG